jgi:hypothetical protein
LIHVSPALRRIATTSALAVAAAGAYALLAPAPAGAAMPRVLTIRFGPDLEVNPVTKDYVNHELGASQSTTIVFPAPIDMIKPFLENSSRPREITPTSEPERRQAA